MLVTLAGVSGDGQRVVAGLDITVSCSGRKGPPGRLSRQGPPVLRWAV